MEEYSKNIYCIYTHYILMQEEIVLLGRLLVELQLVLLCYLLLLRSHLHGGVGENHRNISSMYQVCNLIQKYNLSGKNLPLLLIFLSYCS